MRQVHGSEVVNAAEAVQAAVSPQADGCWTAEPGILAPAAYFASARFLDIHC
jgi:copper oxidase (laccase) domain-containing protein